MNLSQKREEESMKGRRRGGGVKGSKKRGPKPADFMVCFPTRARLKLLPKPICSPSRQPNSENRGTSRRSSLFKAGHLTEQRKNRERRKGLSLMALEGEGEVREPTSPKVTCAGQIKVRSGTSEKGKGQLRQRRPNWVEALGLKKDFFNLIAAFRGIKLKISCLGGFHGSVIDDSTTLDGDDDDEGIEGQEEKEEESTYELSKWFTSLEDEKRKNKTEEEEEEEEEDRERGDGSIPPPNALLLMRCRSAPAFGLQRRQDEYDTGGGRTDTITDREEENERLVFMSYPPDFIKLSSDIVKETWVVGSNDPLMIRCRSYKS